MKKGPFLLRTFLIRYEQIQKKGELVAADSGPEDRNQLDAGCVPDADIFALPWEWAEKLAGVSISKSLPVWKKLLRISQSAWGHQRRQRGKRLALYGTGLLIMGLALYEETRRQRRKSRKKRAAGE